MLMVLMRHIIHLLGSVWVFIWFCFGCLLGSVLGVYLVLFWVFTWFCFGCLLGSVWVFIWFCFGYLLGFVLDVYLVLFMFFVDGCHYTFIAGKKSSFWTDCLSVKGHF